ncbi:uncharacterized protein LOC135500419 isoform X2 [Lineus longissimus]|uniref:uncharacterized protein LOC135500419 isoform X2 n=1 Tax=Lineus longissimus TaxID=88925 RepID=UPI002B4CA2E2
MKIFAIVLSICLFLSAFVATLTDARFADNFEQDDKRDVTDLDDGFADSADVNNIPVLKRFFNACPKGYFKNPVTQRCYPTLSFLRGSGRK